MPSPLNFKRRHTVHEIGLKKSFRVLGRGQQGVAQLA